MSLEKFEGRSITLSFSDVLSDAVGQQIMGRDEEICL